MVGGHERARERRQAADSRGQGRRRLKGRKGSNSAVAGSHEWARERRQAADSRVQGQRRLKGRKGPNGAVDSGRQRAEGVVKLLIVEGKADVDLEDDIYQTALSQAVHYKH